MVGQGVISVKPARNRRSARGIPFSARRLWCLPICLNLLLILGHANPVFSQVPNLDPVLPGDTVPHFVPDGPFEIDSLELVQSQWISLDGSLPITYEEWKTGIGEPGPFSIQLIGRNNALLKPFDQPTDFCILVNADLYPEIEFYIDRYMVELTGEGYDVELYATSGGTPEDLRAFLKERYYAGMEGCVFVGDLPIAWYEVFDEDDYIAEDEQFPCDIFYMDLDGEYLDSDDNGLYDLHTGDVAPDIWLGRLTASPLTWDGAREVDLIRNYFEKNHLYRSGLRPLNNRALIYIDDDWANGGSHADYCMSDVYDDRILVNDEWTTWDTDYENHLLGNYELVYLEAHSSAFSHTFHRPPSFQSKTSFSEIIGINPKAYFYILFACSNARYVERNYMAGWYVFSQDYGLAAVGSTKLGGMSASPDFLRPIAMAQPIGKALFDWFQSRAHWYGFYGRTIIGDPTLTIRRPAYEIVQYDDGVYEYRYETPSGLGEDVVTLYNVRFTAPVDCTLDQVHFRAGVHGNPGGCRMYFWQSDGVYPTTIIDSVDVNFGDVSWGRTDVSAMNLSFQEGENFHIGLVTIDRWYYDFVRIYASEATSLPDEQRSGAFADGRWQTLHELYGVEHNLAIQACYDPAPGVRLEITPVALPDGEVGQPYYEALEVTGGAPPYEWDIAAGELPDGLEFDHATGTISGIPTLAGTGTHVLTARVTDTDNPPNTDIQHLQISIPYCLDSDGDSFGDQGHPENTCPTDNCPSIFNPDQEDSDGDGIGDSCEVIRSWRVLADGAGDAPTIQAAIDSCTNGDTVLVTDGIYVGSGNRDLSPRGKRILVCSQNGPHSTIIDCEGSNTAPRRAFTFENGEDSSCVIEGFTIRGGFGPENEGMSFAGGGILCENSSPTVKNCIFLDNSATLGGAIYAQQSDPRLIKCTLIGNQADYGAAILVFDHSSVTLENCIIAFNGPGPVVTCLESSGMHISYSDIYGNAISDWVGCIAGMSAINGNISRDPLFCDSAAGDFRIDAVSPCAPQKNPSGLLIGALEVGCSNWRTICEASLTDDNLAIIVPGLRKRGVPIPGRDIDVVPELLFIRLTFCERAEVTTGDSADVFIDVNQNDTFEEDEKYPTIVSQRISSRDITLKVELGDDQIPGGSAVKIASIGEYGVLDEYGWPMDHLRTSGSTTTTLDQHSIAIGRQEPEKFGLRANYPNPFNAITVISYSLGSAGPAKLEIYDILGRRVRTLVDETKAAGKHETIWDGLDKHGRAVSSGMYFIKFVADDLAETRKMILLK